MSSLEAVLDVNEKPVTVPRPFLEIVGTPPGRWTVVASPQSPRLPVELAPRYAVCPSCRERLPLGGQPP